MSVHAQQNVDLGLAPTDVLYDRSLLMDFTHPVAFSPTVLVYRQAPSLPDLFVLLSPLTVDILLALAGAALALTLVICMLETLTRSRTTGDHMALTSRTAMTMLLNSMEVVGGALVLKRRCCFVSVCIFVWFGWLVWFGLGEGWVESGFLIFKIKC